MTSAPLHLEDDLTFGYHARCLLPIDDLVLIVDIAMCERDLGDLGETVFRGWCNAAGLTVHKSEKDRTGWDFFVEFPWKQENGLPKDMLPAPLECKIQIKSTDRKKRRESIAVSNLGRLIKAQLPTFFCFLEFDGNDEPQAAYLIHVDSKIIEKTLKRIRELEVKGDGDKLNKHTIDICYTDKDRLSKANGKSLKSEIEKYVPNGLEKYIEDKNKLLKTLGFEEGKSQFALTFPSNHALNDLVDLSLGIHEEVNIEKSVGYHKRFGILSDNEFLSSGETLIRIRIEPTPAVLKFKEHEFSSGISLNADLYFSAFSTSLTEQQFKFRVKSQLFELTVKPFTGIVQYSFDFRGNQRISLGDLKNHLKLFTLIKKASHPLTLEISDKAKKMQKIPLKISPNDEITDWSNACETAEMALSICQRFSILETEVLVTIDELIRAAQHIESFYYILYGDPKAFQMDFPADFLECQDSKRLAFTSSSMVIIGNHAIGCFWAMVGSLSLVDEAQCMLITDEILFGNELIAVDDEIIQKDIVDEKRNEFEQELQRIGLEVISITP